MGEIYTPYCSTNEFLKLDAMTEGVRGKDESAGVPVGMKSPNEIIAEYLGVL